MKIYEGNIVNCDRKNSVFQYLAEDKGIIRFQHAVPGLI